MTLNSHRSSKPKFESHLRLSRDSLVKAKAKAMALALVMESLGALPTSSLGASVFVYLELDGGR